MKPNPLALLWLTAIATAVGLQAQTPATPANPAPPAAGTQPATIPTPATIPGPSANPGAAKEKLTEVTPATPATAPVTPVPAPSTNRISVPRTFPARPAVTPANPAGTSPAARPGARPGVAGQIPRPGGANPGPGAPGAANAATAAEQEANEAALAAIKHADSPEQMVEQVKFKNMELGQVLEIYGQLTKRTVLRGQGLNVQIQLTYFPETPMTLDETIQALDTVFALNQITTVPTGDKFVLVVPAQQAPQMGGAFSKGGGSNYNEAAQFVTHIVTLKHADIKEAHDLVKLFASPQGANAIVAMEATKTLILRDYAINVKRMLEVLEKVDVEVEDDFLLEAIPIKYGKVNDLYQTLQAVISGSGGGAGGGGNTGLQGTGGGFGGGGFGGNRGGGFNRGGSGQNFGNSSGMGSRGGQFNNYYPNQAVPPTRVTTSVGTGGTTFSQRAGGVGRGAGTGLGAFGDLLQNANITPDLRSNQLIVYARKKELKKIKEVVEKVDTLLAQVLIEAIIMEVSLNDTLNYGVTAGQSPKQFGSDPRAVGGGTINNGGDALGTGNRFLGGLSSSTNALSSFPTGSGLNYFMQLGNNWDLAVNALATDGRVNVIQRPRVLTSHATPGAFEVGSEVPFVSGNYFGGGFGNSTQIQRQFVGVSLDVVPFITPDNLVVMEISQSIDQLGPSIRVDNNDIPTTQRRSASSTVTVRDKDSILLGGYINSTTSRSKSGVPVLQNIPLLGNLFSSRSKNGTRSELMVMMRPTILATPVDAAAVADKERERLPGVRVAEQEFERDEREANRKADKRMADEKAKQEKADEKARRKSEKR